MNLARTLERRLEKLLEGAARKVFSGRLHPTEIAARLAREADFARFETDVGPGTANDYRISVNPRDLAANPLQLEGRLARELDAYAAEEGLRLEGPVVVSVVASPEVAQGQMRCEASVELGPPEPWARLSATDQQYDIRWNRTLVGRSDEADVLLPFPEISRRQATIWREAGQTSLSDLGSANGTNVDGHPVTTEPVRVASGSIVSFAGHSYRFMVL